MEAFIVPQIQPQTSPAQSQQSGNNGTNESSFAPALDKALAEHDNTNHNENASDSDLLEHPQKHIGPETANTLGGNEDFDLESTYALHSEIIPEKHSQTSFSPGNGEKSISIGESTQKHTSVNQNFLPDQQAISADIKTVGQQRENISGIINKPIISQLNNDLSQAINDPYQLNNPKSNELSQISASVLARLNSTPAVNPGGEQSTITHRIDEHLQGLGNNVVNQTGTVQNLSLSQSTLSVPSTIANGQFVHLQENESIAFTQTKKDNHHVIFQNPTTHIVENSSGNTKSTPALSTESLLTEITQQPPLSQTHSLRSNTISLRQDIAAQYMDKSLSRETIVTNQSLGQQQFETEGENQNQSQFSNAAKSGDAGGENIATQSTSPQTTEKPLFSMNESLKPGNPPLSSQFTENNILNQVIQKMRLSQNIHDSKLVMKLHPAELGELKIDIQLKEGTIQASIVAHNQQVQEILEKNMPRLREMMEQQGLIVDDITVNLDGDLGSEYNLFEDHFAQEEDTASSKKNKGPHRVLSIEDEVPETLSETSMNSDSMVNVKV